jgi:hypothetical protein
MWRYLRDFTLGARVKSMDTGEETLGGSRDQLRRIDVHRLPATGT